MVSQKLNFLIDISAGIVFVICVLSGFFMRSEFLSLNIHDIHIISAWILIFIVAIHLILHYEWIKEIPCFFKKKIEKKKD